ncbi:hypothetical protein [Amycolatopsis sp. cmx-11-32]|uniref:hypothetical protein n=1 Tax=Amycolatopsis sp. cmx-11-32 TaxID=2785796 RepID=UPI0039E43CA6
MIHDELDVAVVEIKPWGLNVKTGNGQDGFIDNTKNPRWVEGAEGPNVGEELHVVVLDDTVVPFRASALTADIEIARQSK